MGNVDVIQRYVKRLQDSFKELLDNEELNKRTKKAGETLKAIWQGKASITPDTIENIRVMTSELHWSVKWAEEVAKMPAENVKPYLQERIRDIAIEKYTADTKKQKKPPTVEQYGQYVFCICASHLEILLLLDKYELTGEFRQWVAEYAQAAFDKKPPYDGYTYTPPTKHNIPNDKITHNINNATPEEWAYGELSVIEQKAGKNKPEITSRVTFELDALKKLGYNTLDRFDLFVLHTCIAIHSAGNDVTTINSIYRAMTGKDGKARPPKALSDAILDSLIKLMSLPVTIDATGICEWYKYKGEDSLVIDTMLPARIERNVVNGVAVKAVMFRGESPLVRVARAKGNQFLTYESNLLAVPINATRQNVTLAPYLLQKIEDTRGGKLTKVILIDKLIDELQIEERRSRLVQCIEKCFEYWVNVGYVKAFEMVKEGNKITKVKFSI